MSHDTPQHSYVVHMVHQCTEVGSIGGAKRTLQLTGEQGSKMVTL